MGPLGHLSAGMAARNLAPRIPLAVLLVAAWLLDLLAIGLPFVGIDRTPATWNMASHSLAMAVVWSVLAGVGAAWLWRSRRGGLVVGAVVFSHWLLDLVSHPIPFASFSFRTWHWDTTQTLPSDLPVFLPDSPRMGLGLYNHMSALAATLLEAAMFLAGTVIWLCFRRRPAPPGQSHESS